ncbi:MAG: hypothetical protein ACE144_08785 [Thermodesulfobacteriota bacterium]
MKRRSETRRLGDTEMSDIIAMLVSMVARPEQWATRPSNKPKG